MSMSNSLETLKEYEQEFVYADEYFDIIEKELKALEIIKTFGLSKQHISLILLSDTYDNYLTEMKKYYDMFKYEVPYSQEEYDLLKEVLRYE